MKDLLGFFEDDWRRIPVNYRYLFFAGFSLIFIAWLGDHWDDQQKYRVPFFNSNENAFQVGVCIIGLFFVTLVIKQILLWIHIIGLRRKYPFKKLNDSFYLVSFQGAIYLLDNSKKERLHIKTPQTATDLEFWLWGWETIPNDMKSDSEITLHNGNKIKWSDYEDNHRGIITQL